MRYITLIGLKADQIPQVDPILQELKKQYPDQKYNVMPSRFPQYDYVLACFSDDYNKAQIIGMSLVKKHLASIPGLFYWVKEEDKP